MLTLLRETTAVKITNLIDNIKRGSLIWQLSGEPEGLNGRSFGRSNLYLGRMKTHLR